MDSGDPTVIVAIGASAGGLDPIQAFVEAAPSGAGIAYILLQHLSPDHPTLMRSLLGRHTTMPTITAEDGTRVVGNTVYLLPPGREMSIENGTLFLRPQIRSAGEPVRPIDHFMVSLAADRGERAVGVILSGTGSDGAEGVRAISEAGGLTMVQDSSAAFSGMTDAALRTGRIDHVLEPRRMPGAIVAFTDDPSGYRAEQPRPGTPHQRVIDRLQAAFGLDFSVYKPSTVNRRIERRIQQVTDGSEAAYLDLLDEQPVELRNLYHDLLIGVTEFFRDPEAWQVLAMHVDELTATAEAEQRELRAWVAGCATGEEAYSVAIMLDEAVERAGREVKIRVFATDADSSSIEFAAQGRYPSSALSSLPERQRQRYFTPDGDHLRVTTSLRNLVTFTPHNLLSEAPFTRLDLVTCRNLLIYLNPQARARALALLHFSLRPQGLLFLGSSESADPYASEFDDLDSRSRVLRKQRSIRLFGAGSLSGGNQSPHSFALPRTTVNERLLRAYDSLLGRAHLTGFLIDEQRRPLHVFGEAGNLLSSPEGRYTGDLLDRLDHSLRVPLWGAIQQAMSQSTPVTVGDLTVQTSEGVKPATIEVLPLPDRLGGPPYCLLSVSTVADGDDPAQGPALTALSRSESQDPPSSADALLLERELQLTRETLQSTVEELEAANEELIASNEELQSTNEELQSVNEELHTVNSEYEEKIADLTELTNDLDNLLASSGIGVLFLDEGLTLRRFTPEAAELFRLRDTDIGRRVAELVDRAGLEGFPDQVAHTLASGEHQERKLALADHTLLIRADPYLVQGESTGVVITVVDIDDLAAAEAAITEERDRFGAFMENSPASSWGLDDSGRFSYLNAAFEETFGVAATEAIGHRPEELADTSTNAAALARLVGGPLTPRDPDDSAHETAIDVGGELRVFSTSRFLFTYQGRTHTGGSAVDITDLRTALRGAEETARQLQLFMDNTPELIWVLGADNRIEFVNGHARALTESDPVGRHPVEVYGQIGNQLVEMAQGTTLMRPFGPTGPDHLSISRSAVEGGQLLIGTDVSGLVHVQSELEGRNQEMAQRNEELDHFAHLASHDLRAPIRALRLLADQTLAGDLDPSELATEVASAADRLRQVVESLLGYAEIGRFQTRAMTLDLDEIVEAVRQDLRAELATAGATIEAQHLPRWTVDPTLIRRALMNLALNSIRHGGVENPQIIITARRLGATTLDLIVTDNGRGIRVGAEHDPFDPFIRGAGSAPGSGMGLAVVRRVAQRHGGEATLIRSDESGTSVRLRLRHPAGVSLDTETSSLDGGTR